MNIELEVSGGTAKAVRFNVKISDALAGNLQVDRTDFTKLCELLFNGNYKITGSPAMPKQ